MGLRRLESLWWHDRRPLQSPHDHRIEFAGLEQRDLDDRLCGQLLRHVVGAGFDGDQRSLLYTSRTGIDRRLSFQAHAIAGHWHPSNRYLCGPDPSVASQVLPPTRRALVGA